MRFKVGDKVMCIQESLYKEIEKGKMYTISKAFVNDYGKELVYLKDDFNGAWSADRFSYVIEEDIRSEFDLALGVIYGTLYDRIKDTDEDLWIVAETIAEALGEVGDKL